MIERTRTQRAVVTITQAASARQWSPDCWLRRTAGLEAPARAQGPGTRRRFQGPDLGIRPQADGRRNGRSSRSSTRTATSGWTPRSGKPRASGSLRTGARRLRPSAADAGGFGARRHGAGVAGPAADARRREVVSAQRAALRPGTLRTVFLQFENADWEQELAAFNNTDVEVPATVDRRRQDLQGRRRALPRHVVVHDGARGFEALAEPVVRLRRRASRRSAAIARSTCSTRTAIPTFLRAVALLRDRARTTSPRRRPTTCASSINGESWGIYVNAQQFNKDFTARLLQEHDRARAGRCRAARAAAAAWSTSATTRRAYKRIYEIKTKDDAEGRGPT